MVPAFSYKLVCEHMLHYPPGIRLAGFLFARPDSPLARGEIIESLQYFHHRSGENVDFFCAGYGMYWENWRQEFPDQRPVSGGANPWLFSALHFNRFRVELENLTRWVYSGGVDLILSNAIIPGDRANPKFDFSSSVVCQLDRLIDERAIISVEQFFEQVFRYAEKSTGTDPAWGFSDTMGFKKLGSALRSLVFSLFPKGIGKDIERIAEFAIRDIGRVT